MIVMMVIKRLRFRGRLSWGLSDRTGSNWLGIPAPAPTCNHPPPPAPNQATPLAQATPS